MSLRTAPRTTRPGPAVMALLRACLAEDESYDWAAVPPDVIERAVDIGLGPVVARAADMAGAGRHLPLSDRLRAAALTARALTADKYETVAAILTAARAIDCPVVLLKGAATALCYYPEPHLRTMGDIDLLVPAERHSLLDAKLRPLGFEQRSSDPAATLAHHGNPWCDVSRGTWVDIHSRLYPVEHPLADHSLLWWPSISSHLTPVPVGRQIAFAMSHELQLIYTSARWADTFNPARGIYPIIDVALLIRKHGNTLNWDVILAAIQRSWAASAVHLMLSFVCRWELAVVPSAVLETLGAADHHLNRLSIRLLHGLTTEYVVGGRRFGSAVTTQGHLEKTWNSLLGTRSPTANLVSIPYNVAFPAGHPERFSPRYAARRVRVFVRRVVLNSSERGDM